MSAHVVVADEAYADGGRCWTGSATAWPATSTLSTARSSWSQPRTPRTRPSSTTDVPGGRITVGAGPSVPARSEPAGAHAVGRCGHEPRFMARSGRRSGAAAPSSGVDDADPPAGHRLGAGDAGGHGADPGRRVGPRAAVPHQGGGVRNGRAGGSAGGGRPAHPGRQERGDRGRGRRLPAPQGGRRGAPAARRGARYQVAGLGVHRGQGRNQGERGQRRTAAAGPAGVRRCRAASAASRPGRRVVVRRGGAVRRHALDSRQPRGAQQDQEGVLHAAGAAADRRGDRRRLPGPVLLPASRNGVLPGPLRPGRRVRGRRGRGGPG